MPSRRLVVASAVFLLASASARAQGTNPGVELAGVRYAPTAQVGGATLQLNGAGIRYKFVVKVYTAGLYLLNKASTPEQVLQQAGPKRIQVVMLRDIDANELGRLFTRGMEENASKDDFSKSIPGTIAMADIFSSRKKLVAGDMFSVDWVPGQGASVLVNGKALGPVIKEPEFFVALLRIWLGNRPADNALKEALLGHEARNPMGSNGQ